MLEAQSQHPSVPLFLCSSGLLCLAFLAPALIMRHKSVTFDEVTHLPSGYSYWVQHDIRYNRQHPPLIKELCALPLILMGIKGPDNFPGSEWDYGYQFLFNGSADASWVLFWGRIPVVLLSTGLAVLIMIWSGKLWGRTGGLLALFLYVFDPTITAHSQFVTTDVGVAFFSTAYLFSLRSYFEKPSIHRILVSGCLLGLALASKFSAVILLPVTAVLMVLATRRPQVKHAEPGISEPVMPRVERRNGFQNFCWKSSAAVMIILLGLAGFTIWLIYFCPSDPYFYWKGIQSVQQDHAADSYYYLHGTLKNDGWKIYLLVAWLIKTPIPSLVLLIVAVVLFFKGSRASAFDEAFLIIPAASFFFFYSWFGDNIGVRYLIPCFPFLFIFSGRLATQLTKERKVYRWALACFLLWQVSEYAAIMPDHLSYFNQVAGGSNQGINWLDNSNVDWGQGLFQLRDFIEVNRIRDFAYFYFGTGDPAYYGIHGRRIEDFRFVIL